MLVFITMVLKLQLKGALTEKSVIAFLTLFLLKRDSTIPIKNWYDWRTLLSFEGGAMTQLKAIDNRT